MKICEDLLLLKIIKNIFEIKFYLNDFSSCFEIFESLAELELVLVRSEKASSFVMSGSHDLLILDQKCTEFL